ncbi:MAG: acyl-CoA thioesterase [Coriobacteriales bacterium]|jgi:acyl-CoA hydrolase
MTPTDQTHATSATGATGADATTTGTSGITIPHDDYERPGGVRTVSYSTTVATHTAIHTDMNGISRLTGGRLMEWIDEVAGIAARRHCSDIITTASVEPLVFLRPAFLNDIVTIVGTVTHVGRTSLEVRVDSFVEDNLTGERTLINRAYLTEVCLDENSRPKPIRYGLALETDEQRAEWEAARLRVEQRRERRAGERA